MIWLFLFDYIIDNRPQRMQCHIYRPSVQHMNILQQYVADNEYVVAFISKHCI